MAHQVRRPCRRGTASARRAFWSTARVRRLQRFLLFINALGIFVRDEMFCQITTRDAFRESPLALTLVVSVCCRQALALVNCFAEPRLIPGNCYDRYSVVIL